MRFTSVRYDTVSFENATTSSQHVGIEDRRGDLSRCVSIVKKRNNIETRYAAPMTRDKDASPQRNDAQCADNLTPILRGECVS